MHQSGFSLSPVVYPLTAPASYSPVDLFAHFAEQQWSGWLDSGQTAHPDANWDIIVFAPFATLTYRHGAAQFEHKTNKSKESLTGNPFALLEQLQQRCFPILNQDESLPFIGGIVATFNYDLARQLESLPNLATQDIDMPDLQAGFYHSAVLFNHQKKQFYFVSISPDAEKLKADIEHCMQTATPKPAPFQLTGQWQANMNAKQYQAKFAQVQAYLQAGDCYQINLAQRFVTGYTGSEFSAYLALRKHNKAPFSAFLNYHNNHVLSVSPERFLLVNKDKIQTKPIKGTRPRSNDANEDEALKQALQTAVKDRAENLMIVDLLRNDLSKVASNGSVNVPSLFAIESFPSVHHLVSTVEAKLDAQFSAINALESAFPGGSITGAPKIRAMEIIEELEPHRRATYCGAIAYLSACGKMDSNIAIRTLVCSQKSVYCWAGGGLVADSNVEAEYQETFDKVSKILPVLDTLSCKKPSF